MINNDLEISALVAQARNAAEALEIHLTVIERALNCSTGRRPKLIPNKEDRRNTRRKIESDRELEQFIQERIFDETFPAVAAAVAAHFGPERRVAISSIHRWWHRTGKHLRKPQSAIPRRS